MDSQIMRLSTRYFNARCCCLTSLQRTDTLVSGRGYNRMVIRNSNQQTDGESVIFDIQWTVCRLLQVATCQKIEYVTTLGVRDVLRRCGSENVRLLARWAAEPLLSASFTVSARPSTTPYVAQLLFILPESYVGFCYIPCDTAA